MNTSPLLFITFILRGIRYRCCNYTIVLAVAVSAAIYLYLFWYTEKTPVNVCKKRCS